MEEFTPEESEDRLYHLVSEYLQRDNLQALPSRQRSLMTLVLRKLLASSTFAIAGALTTISNRLKAQAPQARANRSLEDELDQDYEALDETAEEWADDESAEAAHRGRPHGPRAGNRRPRCVYASWPRPSSTTPRARHCSRRWISPLPRQQEIGAAQKAIIFTESRRTQNYLLRLLGDSPFAEGIVLFNGSNTDERSRQIYSRVA